MLSEYVLIIAFMVNSGSGSAMPGFRQDGFSSLEACNRAKLVKMQEYKNYKTMGGFCYDKSGMLWDRKS